MVIKTKELGFVEVAEKDIITFARPLYGFEDVTHFALLSDRSKPDNPFMWLQCADRPEPCFAVADPYVIFHDYAPRLSAEDERTLGLTSARFLRLVVIATVPREVRKLSVNLRCPIAINSEDNTAIQAILDNQDYPMKYCLFEKRGDGHAGADKTAR